MHIEDYPREWDAFLDDLQQTLDYFAVPAQEQVELKTIVNSTRSDIVTDSAPLAQLLKSKEATELIP